MSANRNLSKQQFVEIFHGTDTEAEEGIKAFGLHPAEGNPAVHTVAYDTKTAEEYAHDAADYRGGEPAVMRFKVPEQEWYDEYLGDHEDWGHSVAAGLRKTVPPHYLASVRHPRKRPGGYYS